jgi:hypothetical protein
LNHLTIICGWFVVKINENVQKQIKTTKNNILKDNVLDALFIKNKFNVPKSLITYRKQILSKTKELSKDEEKNIRKNIAIEILIKEIIKKENIKLKKIEVENKLNEINKLNLNFNSDKIKKTIYYKNAWLKIYDVPVLYFPTFFHPSIFIINCFFYFIMPSFFCLDYPRRTFIVWSFFTCSKASFRNNSFIFIRKRFVSF